ncbi:hypothetical protein PPERSA_05379 [Pseudocohnilembus persalinus]|uniref:Uncharacterized protein n=1 Tax=Pseudocohnilembus persalinus TaxID=266149 RepID=A0A0V0R7S6_PSEPJ|nr:hypothetical protein PPERSA_05379 [Pseudocohnilembus persalinus]|eukprot:KRX10559.1 hypothetical protein PPERSA_05379 [Pseudocohnilembus persalinus]
MEKENKNQESQQNQAKKQQRKQEIQAEKEQVERKMMVQLSKLNQEINMLKELDEQSAKFLTFNEIFNEFFQKIQTILKRSEHYSLPEAFQLCYDFVKEEKYIQNHYILCLVLVQSFVKIGENLGIFDKKNVFSMAIKLFISEKLDDLSYNQTFRNLLFGFCFLNQGIPIWKKNRDHVPELYMTINNILLFVLDYIENVDFSGDDKNQGNISQRFEQIFNQQLLSQMSEEDSILYQVQDEDIGTFIEQILNQLKHIIKIHITESNFDLLYKPILNKLREIEPYLPSRIQNKCTELVEKIAEMSQGYEIKQKLEIIIDKPLMKIKQLDPRIIDYKAKEHKKDHIKERQKVQKKIKKEKRKTVSDIKEDMKMIQLNKEKIAGHKDQEGKKKVKDFNSFLVDQQKEIKKMKTTQINRERNKKHSKRQAGNKMDSGNTDSKKGGRMDIPRF